MKTLRIFIWSIHYDEMLSIVNLLQKLCKEIYHLVLTNNSEDADVYFTNQWKSNDKNVDINKKIIYWSGESYPNKIIMNNLPYLELNSFVSNSNTSCHFPHIVVSKYWNKDIRMFNDEKTKFLAFCVSNNNCYANCENRVNIFNKFCEAFPDEKIEALGSVYGNYKEKHRKIEGNHLTTNTIEEYSKFKFILAIENNIKEGYVTEKIMNAFASGSVPIYQGCSKTVAKQFNKNCYIDINDFSSVDECINYVKNITDEKYKEMVSSQIYNTDTLDVLNIIDENGNYNFDKSKYWTDLRTNICNLLI
jgi:hypothetical protein